MLEKNEESKFLDWCRRRGYLCLKIKLAEYRGFPDRMIVTPQKVLFMEFKTPVGETSPQQDYWLEVLNGYPSSPAFVPRSCQEAINYVEQSLLTVTTKDNEPATDSQ